MNKETTHGKNLTRTKFVSAIDMSTTFDNSNQVLYQSFISLKHGHVDPPGSENVPIPQNASNARFLVSLIGRLPGTHGKSLSFSRFRL